MKAVVRNTYGPSSVLRIEEVEMPTVGDGDVLVRVRAVSVNPAEWYSMTGTPYIARLDGGLPRRSPAFAEGPPTGRTFGYGSNRVRDPPHRRLDAMAG